MADLPHGAVTFLFTDIEGSTRLVRQLRERYAEVLGEHQRLLREAFAGHGGHEVDTQGDSFFYAFSSAREAVQAAIEGQRALSGYPWPDGNQVRVRMGIHTGQAAPVDGRYTGLAVHRAARIQAAAHGGQVLVSQATQSLLEDEEEDLAVGLRDLGEQRLKDIDRPVRLYQVAAPGLAAEFPPLRREEEAPAAAPAERPWLSRRVLLVAGIAAALVIAGVVALLATRGGGGGLPGVDVNHVGLIDPETGDITAQVQTGLRPGPVAVGSNDVWVGDLDDRDLARIDAGTETPGPRTPLENQTPTGLTIGGGAVWVAHGLLGAVSRVDPQYNRVAWTKEVGGGLPGDGAVAFGGGSVWAVFGDSTLARINPATRGIVTTFAGANPSGIVYAEGAVWVANGGGASVDRFNPATFEAGEPVATVTVARQPSGIAYGEGAIWVACAGDDVVYRIDPDSSSVAQTIQVGDRPTAIAAGDGSVWVANSGDGTVSRIDAETYDVKTIHTGNAPSGIAIGPSGVWVTVQAR